MTRRDVALITNLHLNTIARFENGEPVKFSTLYLIAEALEVSIYYMTKGIT